jgi:head-tail adaptor
MSPVTINPGEMRTSITLQSPTVAKDAGGFQKAGYANAGTNPTVLARWVNAHGDENASASGGATSSAVKFAQRATVTIRARTDIDTTWQVLKDGEAWNIISVDPIRGENRWVELVVERAKGSI